MTYKYDPKLEFGHITPLTVKMDELAKTYIENVLILTNYHLNKSAEVLGISRTSLYRRMKKYGIAEKRQE